MYFVVRDEIIEVYNVFVFHISGWKWLKSRFLRYKNFDSNFLVIEAASSDKKMANKRRVVHQIKIKSEWYIIRLIKKKKETKGVGLGFMGTGCICLTHVCLDLCFFNPIVFSSLRVFKLNYFKIYLSKCCLNSYSIMSLF